MAILKHVFFFLSFEYDNFFVTNICKFRYGKLGIQHSHSSGTLKMKTVFALHLTKQLFMRTKALRKRLMFITALIFSQLLRFELQKLFTVYHHSNEFSFRLLIKTILKIIKYILLSYA